MAVFKAIEKKASAIRDALRAAELIVKHLTKVLTLLNVLLKSVKLLLTLAKKVVRFLRRIIRAILSVLKRAGKFAGPLKVIIKPLRLILVTLQKGLRAFEKIVQELSESIRILNLGLKYDGGARNKKKLLDDFLKKVRQKAEKVQEIARLLEKQQKWLEKVLPPALIKKLWDLVKSLTAPLNRIVKITKKIIKALEDFIKKLLGIQKVVDDLKEQFKELNKWLNEVRKVTDTINWIITEIEKFLKKIPGIGFVINILQLIGAFIDWLIKKTGVEALLKWILDKSGIIDALANGLKQIIGAIKGLVKDFKAIIDDIGKLLGELNKVLGILTNLEGWLRLIALFKWLFGFQVPKRFQEFELGLQLLANPEMETPFISSENSVLISVETITIKGKGIGNDWNFTFTLGDDATEIAVTKKGNRINRTNTAISSQTVNNSKALIENTLTVVAVENDPVFDDFGMHSEVIRIENSPQETTQQVEFTVQASGGDKGATATITIQLKITVEAVEDVLVPFSELGRENVGINYLEHTLHNLKTDVGNTIIAPALMAKQHALHQFIVKADTLINSLKDAIIHGREQQGIIEEFSAVIQESRKEIVPAEEMNFEASYFIELFEKSNPTLEKELFFSLFTGEAELLEDDTDIEIQEEEDPCAPILTTDIADRPFDLDDTFDITDFINIDTENPLR